MSTLAPEKPDSEQARQANDNKEFERMMNPKNYAKSIKPWERNTPKNQQGMMGRTANKVADKGIDKAGQALAAETAGASIVAAEVVKRHKREALILALVIILVPLLPVLFIIWMMVGQKQTTTTCPGTIAPASQTATGEKSTAEYMAIYGHNAAEVEANLVSINFQGKSVKVHKKVQAVFEKVNNEITQANTGYAFSSVGTYSWRQKNGGTGLSTHSFGITMDINPVANPYTAADIHDIPPEVAQIFKNNGFAWGGDWQPRHDWMHFQYEGAPDALAAGAGGAATTDSTATGTAVASSSALALGAGAAGTQTGGSGCPPSGGGGAAGVYLPPVVDACGGKYKLTNPIGQNFGDPECKVTKDDIINKLRAQDPTNADRWITIVQCESGFNPNAYASPATGTPDPGGAWGLFQTGHSFPPGQPPSALGQKVAGGPTRQYDRGDTVWSIQVENAVNLSKGIRSLEAYWACAR